jgi:3-methyladenine DNA glycosylase AlkD
VPFRGTPMGSIRKIVHDVWDGERLDGLPRETKIDIALAQFGQRYCEDKLAGVLMLSERLMEDIRSEDVELLARPFDLRHIDDWNTCDWYCVKVLGRFVDAKDHRRRARAIAAWRLAELLWQRRAAAVAFVNLAPRGDGFFEGFTQLLLTVCARNVRDDARFSQTSVGWLLRELSRAEREQVASFVERNREVMSKEALKAATTHLR